jgi:hypothetical protein
MRRSNAQGQFETPVTDNPPAGATRRQARFCTERAIPPSGVRTDRWYEICEGRRRDDHREGMVLMDLGDQRMLVPADCLLFRSVPIDAPAEPLPAPRRRAEDRAAVERRLRRALVAVAASVVPVGLVAGWALSRVPGFRSLAS